MADPPRSLDAGSSPDRPPRRLADIDWSRWEARDRATLTFVVESDRMLLIRKKRGLGAGKINGPGGRIEPGESARECAVREVEEELGITPRGLDARGELRFQFTDGYSIHVFVFFAAHYEGEPRETAEAIPLWFPVDAVPYHEMWADDVLWLPRVIAGERVKGRFVFDGDDMLDHHLE
jgi:8-oxo-dGTP diphosphatase